MHACVRGQWPDVAMTGGKSARCDYWNFNDAEQGKAVARVCQSPERGSQSCRRFGRPTSSRNSSRSMASSCSWLAKQNVCAFQTRRRVAAMEAKTLMPSAMAASKSIKRLYASVRRLGLYGSRDRTTIRSTSLSTNSALACRAMRASPGISSQEARIVA